MTKRTAGSDIDSYCGKCGMELAHVIIAMEGARVARVECKTCHSTHAHRSIDVTSRRAPTPRKPTRTRLGTSAFDRVMEGKDASRPTPYQATRAFTVGEVLAHPSFGTGCVTALLSDKKIEVVFRDSMRVLVHAR